MSNPTDGQAACFPRLLSDTSIFDVFRRMRSVFGTTAAWEANPEFEKTHDLLEASEKKQTAFNVTEWETADGKRKPYPAIWRTNDNATNVHSVTNFVIRMGEDNVHEIALLEQSRPATGSNDVVVEVIAGKTEATDQDSYVRMGLETGEEGGLQTSENWIAKTPRHIKDPGLSNATNQSFVSKVEGYTQSQHSQNEQFQNMSSVTWVKIPELPEYLTARAAEGKLIDGGLAHFALGLQTNEWLHTEEARSMKTIPLGA